MLVLMLGSGESYFRHRFIIHNRAYAGNVRGTDVISVAQEVTGDVSRIATDFSSG